MTAVAQLEVRGLRKAYTAPVLRDFDFSLRSGEVHALIGSNGAGKSTFSRIVCGLTPADGGELFLEGKPYSPHSKPAATQAGVVMVLQELSIIPTLTVAENLFLDRLPQRWGLIDRATLRRQAATALSRVGLSNLDPDLPAGRLGVGQQQLVEIAAALDQDCRVLILDEPSAALTATETTELFARIRDLQAKGVGIIYISHRMDEIRRIADRVTVLRDGQRIATHEAAHLDLPTLIGQMTGRAVTATATRHSAITNTVALEVRGLQAGKLVKHVDLLVHAGEILGIAGLVGSGRTELLRAIFGADPKTSGEIFVQGKRLEIHQPVDAVAGGISLVPEDRKADGLLLTQSIRFNATLATQTRFARRGFLDDTAEHHAVQELGTNLEIACATLEQRVSELSGGNQQKVVVARWLLRDTPVLLFDEPTRGIDVAAKETIYRLLAALARAGKAIVIVSSELPELMANCDRITVMSAGLLVGEFSPSDWSEEKITAAAFHGYLDQAPPSAS